MNLSDLRPPAGQTKPRKRIGRGMGSGHGKTSTRGSKGQRAGTGFGQKRGFEGGQMPLYRKLPHRGFNNYNHRVEFTVINVGDLASLDAKVNEVNAQVLSDAGLIRRDETRIKILGDGEIGRPLKVTAAKFSESAKAKIEKAGGQAVVA